MSHNKRFRLAGLLTTIAIIVVLLVGGLLYYLIAIRPYTKSDDAYVRSPIIALSSLVSGRVTAIYVDQGQEVAKGELLCKIDKTQYEYLLQKAKAEEKALLAGLNDAKSNYDRAHDLYKEGVISDQSYDSIKAAYDQAMHNHTVAQIAVEQARFELAHTDITAPSNGSIAKRAVEVGAFTAPGISMFGFVQSDQRWVEANYKETELHRIQVGDQALITIDALPKQTFQGRVAALSPATGATFALLPASNATGNFSKVVQRIPVKMEFINLAPSDLRQLRTGLSATVRIKRKG
ncbi:HlyD family secretion protein [Simkania negevensis]|uniref:HlyD family secretion protein n=1 Tax=Simkania negevensis TaxID=83561 RepID=A0ABS3AUG0_9BACT|nr:HlyD family secretion protein [Simkania negevensis]